MSLRPRRTAARAGTAGATGQPDEPVFEDLSEVPLHFPEPAAVSGRRRRRRALLLSLTALAVLLGLVAMLYFSPLLLVRSITVQDNELLTDQRAAELLEPLHGVPLPQVGHREVAALLEEELVVEEVVVAAELPHGLLVEVHEHPPVAEVHTGDEILFYNEHGEVIRTFEERERPDAEGYPTVEIDSQAALDNEAVFKTIASVLGQLPAEARQMLDSATAESRDSVQLQLQDGRTVVWGSDDRGEAKAQVLEAILASDAEGFGEADLVDISTPSAPVTR